jgi:hypothetical protein
VSPLYHGESRLIVRPKEAKATQKEIKKNGGIAKAKP